MNTWRDLNSTWEYTLWTNDRERTRGVPWKYQRLINLQREWNGKADLMRYELLLEHGGLCVDADSECILPLPDSFLEHDAFACWENEKHLPGTVATGYLAARAGSPLMKDVLDTINLRARDPRWPADPAWRTVGPVIFTEVAKRHPELFVYPAKCFIPDHYSGVAPAESELPVYAKQFWGSTIHSPHYKYKGLT